MPKVKIWLTAFLCWGTLSHVFAQQYHFEQLNQVRRLRLYAPAYQDTFPTLHTSIRPLSRRQLDTLPGAKAILPAVPPQKGWFGRKLQAEHLIDIQKNDFTFQLNPVVNLQGASSSTENGMIYRNDVGLTLEGTIGDKFSFYSTYIEGQGIYPQYVRDFIGTRRVVPGYGLGTKSFGDRGGRYYTFPAGEITFAPNKHFTFTAGQGKNFFGEGYRSMFLSDAAFNYPFFRIETSVGKVRYVNLWAQMNDVRPQVSRNLSGDVVYAKKFLSSHYLSINVTPRWNLSFFEAVIIADSAQQRGLDASFFNPVIFYRPVEWSVGSGQGNAMIGAASSYKFRNGWQAYGQFLLDEFVSEEVFKARGSWVNKFGWQLGIKKYDFILKGLFAQAEYNSARPYTFSHRRILTNHGHYGQPLAHPWGANFREAIFRIIYQRSRWEGEVTLNWGQIGLDTKGENWGSDIYQSYNTRQRDLGNFIAQGNRADMLLLHTRAAYLINPTTGLKAEVGLRWRDYETDITANTRPFTSEDNLYIYLGLRTEFLNEYWDF